MCVVKKGNFHSSILNITSDFLSLPTVGEAEKQQQQEIDGLSSAFVITLTILIILVVTVYNCDLFHHKTPTK